MIAASSFALSANCSLSVLNTVVFLLFWRLELLCVLDELVEVARGLGCFNAALSGLVLFELFDRQPISDFLLNFASVLQHRAVVKLQKPV
ncbi:hypothetical protein NG895_01335 [Aeoliella sp. ICT_H6.2]|uniref:Uncharacterized protein n=1 Tax=Aeoliella straminimaris TaxID=2954799 RepID=A0A9X2JH55_9BACT|nr:hypothetical protein [Aeoliella straminimaris]